MKKILITGVNGFCGSHLVDYIIDNKFNVELYGIIRETSSLENIKYTKEHIALYECDILNRKALAVLIKKIRPDIVYHFAAQSDVKLSWEKPNETYETNIIGQENLLNAIRQHAPEATTIVTCSSEEFGEIQPADIPIAETHKLQPVSPYAVSKVAQDLMSFQYFKNFGTKIIRLRGFNFGGPRRPDKFVDSSFAKQYVEAELGMREPLIKHGNLEAIRDFTHIKDACAAYWLAVEKCSPGEVYNVCSGKGTQIQTILDKLLLIGNIEIKTEQDPVRMRPSDVPVLIGSNDKFCETTGWKPELDITDIINDTYDYWKEELSRQKMEAT